MDCIFCNSFDRIVFFIKKFRGNGMNKKGELTTQQLVVIIILITSFMIVLILFWRLDLGETTNKQICHNSVVLAGKNKGLIGSLDCSTTYVCISKGEGCEGFNPTTTVNVKTDEEILEAVKKEIDDCWWMFGEGKIGYLGISERGVLSKTNCAICSTIKFSEEIKDFDFGEGMICTGEKYSIITGMKSGIGWGIGSKELFIGPNITKSDEIGSFNCDEFISKA